MYLRVTGFMLPAGATTYRRWKGTRAAIVMVALIVGACGSVLPASPSPEASFSTTMAPSSAHPSPSPTAEATPTAAAWTAAGDMPGVRGPEAFATLLRDGRVLVVGRGIGPNQQLADSAVIYDPSTARWSATETVPTGIGSATRLGDGTVLVTGAGPSGSSAERYDPTAGRWTATGTMTVGRPQYTVTKDGSGWDPAGYTATMMLDGKVLVAGGRTGAPGSSPQIVVPNAELYDPDTGRWTTIGSMVHARVGHTATLLPDGKVLVVGGATYHTDGSLSVLGSAELYDPATGTWTATGRPHGAKAFHTATPLADGSVLIAGGDGPAGAATERYDPSAGQWTDTGSMRVARREQTATLLLDGRVLAAGGRAADRNGGKPSASAELYDPTTGRWTATASMAGARAQQAAALLADGRVLVVGGEKDLLTMNWLASSELYDAGDQ